MGVLGEMFPRKRIHEDSDAAQGGQRWALGPIDLENGVVTLQAADDAGGGDTEGGGAGDPDAGDPDAGDPDVTGGAGG